MDAPAAKLADFVTYVRSFLTGDEKGEAQIYCDRLFQAFGHPGIKESGGTLEYRVHKGKTTKFADLLWRPRLLLEMKKRGEKLERHYRQAFEYWLHLVPNRPQYVVLCNFDEFWVYDLNQQLDEPMDRVRLDELPLRHAALNFLFPELKQPLFNNNRVAVTRTAADKVARAFNLLVSRPDRPVERARAQRFILQCVLALFAEDIGLLPRDLFTELLEDCKKGASSYDLIGGLFRQMASQAPAEGGRFQNVNYFNGGLFSVVEPIELKGEELALLAEAAAENWSLVNPAIFGTLFEGSMDQQERHAFGAHFTSEADIQKVVLPTIVRPWRERVAAARTAADLLALRRELLRFCVLDPACGSGNFLYIAYRELKRIEVELLDKIHRSFGERTRELAGSTSLVSASQFFGIDIKPFAVELAKVTLMVGKKLALDETQARLATGERHLPFDLTEQPLPLDNLDANIRCADALFCDWPEVEAIIGNPPYLGSRYLAKEHGYDYARKVHAAFPDVPKMADYCVYWFRRAHDDLPPDCRAGLVATNTIRQNETREASLDYVLAKGGTITEAVGTQVWSGEAAVHVSIVNWINGESPGPKKLFQQKGDQTDSEWTVEEAEQINTSLSTQTDLSGATPLQTNRKPKRCFQGQNPVNEGFFLTPAEATEWLKASARLRDVVFPYMIGRDLVENYAPTRWIIDFAQRDLLQAMHYPEAFERVKKLVMPKVLERAEQEKAATGSENTRWTRMAARWWQFRDWQPGTMAAIATIPRYVACARVTKRPIFEFVSSAIHPDTQLIVFPFADDYSFGILQSGLHWAWFTARCSTLKGDFRYTSDTVFDTFPWPQSPTLAQVKKVAAAAVALRALRRKVMAENSWSLRDLYRTLDLPGQNPLCEVHEQLDAAVRAAYGMGKKDEPLAFLLALNRKVAEREEAGQPVTAPGLPGCVPDPLYFVTEDCVIPAK
jgi:hypothetical protein